MLGEGLLPQSCGAPDLPLLFVPLLFGRVHGPRAVQLIAQSLGEEISG